VVNRPGKSGKTQRADGLCAGETIQFAVTDSKGCTATGTFRTPYPEDGCMTVRSVITPGDQDNLNDLFIINCIEEVKNTVEIYNRQGQLVYSAENYNNGSVVWDGTSGGAELPEGTYFYIINYTNSEGEKLQEKGYVSIVR
jgi:gliding motility-associated-like protein